MSEIDQDALVASLGLVGRAGAFACEFGYLEDEGASWWAHAQYQGARVTVEGHGGPVEAVEALARRLLDGATCRRCGHPIRLQDGEGCRWKRLGAKWEPGCGKPVDLSIAAVR